MVFSFSCFLPKEVPLAFVVKLVWGCWILLTFACLESFWFLHQIWRRVLLGRVFLVVGSFITLNISCHSLLACRVFVDKSTDNPMTVPFMLFVIFSLLFLICYLCLYFLSIWLPCVSVCSFFGLPCLGVCASWALLTISFPMLGKFSAIIASSISQVLSLFFWDSYNENVGEFNVFSEVS